MARPPIPDSVQLEIKSWRAAGLTIDAIETKMEEAREAGVVGTKKAGRGSIAKYSKQYDDLPLEKKKLDEPFEWHRLNEYCLPWEASQFLLEMWCYVQELNHALNQALVYEGYLPHPTVRQAHWWWRVHQAAPGQDKDFIWTTAEQLRQCELYRDFLGKAVDVSGIEAYLAYRPWVSENQTLYLQAIEEGRIASYPTLSEDSVRLEMLRGVPELSPLFPEPKLSDPGRPLPDTNPIMQRLADAQPNTEENAE